MFYAGSEYLLLCACLENSLTKINVKTAESAREEDIFIVQSRCSDVNDNLMELLILMSACKTASTRRITRHYPAFSLGADGQGRRLVANMLACAGCDHIITIDLHTNQIQRFFDIPRIDRWPNSIAVSPDVGGTKRFAATLIDDMIDTGRTLAPAARTLHDKDVKTIHVLIWYALPIEELVVCFLTYRSIRVIHLNGDHRSPRRAPQREHKEKCSKIRAIDISAIIAESIQRTYNGESIDLLFGD
ncbi:phosphoribosyltransferase-like protein [Pisolithus croceorrhizus]|nr:phosphoribosyltransferase-like protein [Pisolithus croceorrhizus]KAI6115694.1 phosphoribosyltransferase-like protein [Pisolithus croceorrhizus]KAI6148965.1 phosphoribosyltransferase-like protein [Pisolithus thermaeus]